MNAGAGTDSGEERFFEALPDCDAAVAALFGTACDWLRAHGIRPVIPHKINERAYHDGRTRFDKEAYKRRAVAEQCVGWLKECRRIGTRFEKLNINFHAMVNLAIIKRYLKVLFSDRA